MAESPTVWWCPECGVLNYPFSPKFGVDGTVSHWIETMRGVLSHEIRKVPVITPGLPLPDLAVRLCEAGYEASVPESWGMVGAGVLVVAPTE